MEITTIDDLQQRIDLYTNVCPIAKDYIENGTYLDTEFLPSKEELLSNVIHIVADDLYELGIEFTIPLNELLRDGYRTDLVYHLRYILDKDILINILNTIDNDTYNKIYEYLQCGETNVGITIIQILFSVLPYNTSLNFILKNYEYFTHNTRLVDHIRAIFDKSENISDIITDELIQYTISYMESINNRRDIALSILDQLLSYVTLTYEDKHNLIEEVNNLDDFMLKPFMMRQIINHVDRSEILKSYKPLYKYYLEYYLKDKIIPSKLECILLVSSLYQHGMTHQQLKNKFKVFSYDLEHENFSYIYKLIDRLTLGDIYATVRTSNTIS